MSRLAYYIVKNKSGIDLKLNITLPDGRVVEDIWEAGEVASLNSMGLASLRCSVGWSEFQLAFDVNAITEEQRPVWMKEG